MSGPRTFTFHLRGANEHSPGDAAILDAIQAHLSSSGEIPDCNRSEALRWALHRVSSEKSPVFRHLPAWWQLYRRHALEELGFGALFEDEDPGDIEA